jgi:hypothetical protein
MAGRRLTTVGAEDNSVSIQFDEKTVKVRDMEFKLRELSSGEYDKLYKQAEDKDGEIDTTVLLRLMAHKSVVAPEGFSADDLAALPMRAARTLLGAVNDLHFGDDSEAEAKND